MKRLVLFTSIVLSLFFTPFTLRAQLSQTVLNGANTTPINSPSIGCLYNWVNSNPSIGLPASGSGNIPSFTAINNGSAPITATITAVPVQSTFLYVPNSNSSDISIISTASHSVISTIPLLLGSDPWGVAISPDGSKVYITNQQIKAPTGTVSVISTLSNTVIATIPVGANPVGVVVSPDGSRVYVTNVNGASVAVINAITNQLVTNITTDPGPFGITISPDGKKVYVVCESTSSVAVIDAATNKVTSSIGVGTNPEGIAITPDGNELYVTNFTSNTISVISTVSNSAIATIAADTSPLGVTISPDGSMVFVANQFSNTVSAIDVASNTIIYTVAIPEYVIYNTKVSPSPCGISVSPDGKSVFVAVENSNMVLEISTVSHTIVNSYKVDETPVSFGNFVTNNTVCNTGPVTVTITVNPTENLIAATGTLEALNTSYGTPSLSTRFFLSGKGLAAGILVSPPTGFEISTDNITFSNSLTVGSGGDIPPTIIYVRLSGSDAIGAYSGNIVLSSVGVNNVYVTTITSTVIAAPLSIVANSINKPYGMAVTAEPNSTAFTAIGLKNSEIVGSVNLTYSSGSAVNSSVNLYKGAITPASAIGGTFNPANYSITYLPGDINVQAAPLTATANNQYKIYGQSNPPLTFHYNGFVNNEGPAQLTTLPIATTTAVTSSPAGNYPILVSGGVADNYYFIYVPAILTVSQAIQIPSAFTPNGDGINDTWDIKYLNDYANCTVEVINRYGEKVFFSNNYPIPWNGRYKGGDLPAGTYYYIINLNNGNKTLAGPLTIIR